MRYIVSTQHVVDAGDPITAVERAMILIREETLDVHVCSFDVGFRWDLTVSPQGVIKEKGARGERGEAGAGGEEQPAAGA